MNLLYITLLFFLHISSVQKYMHNSEEVLPYLVEIIVEVNHSTNMNFLRKGIQTHTSSFIGLHNCHKGNSFRHNGLRHCSCDKGKTSTWVSYR